IFPIAEDLRPARVDDQRVDPIGIVKAAHHGQYTARWVHAKAVFGGPIRPARLDAQGKASEVLHALVQPLVAGPAGIAPDAAQEVGTVHDGTLSRRAGGLQVHGVHPDVGMVFGKLFTAAGDLDVAGREEYGVLVLDTGPAPDRRKDP